MPHLMKICRVGAEMFHAGGQTDRHDEAGSRSSQYLEGAENWKTRQVLCVSMMGQMKHELTTTGRTFDNFNPSNAGSQENLGFMTVLTTVSHLPLRFMTVLTPAIHMLISFMTVLTTAIHLPIIS
jgi:hypothetical protein